MKTATLNRAERETLYAAHRTLGLVHSRITTVTEAQNDREEDAEKALDAQLAISDAMMAVAKALNLYSI
jgi:hypothetical protein